MDKGLFKSNKMFNKLFIAYSVIIIITFAAMLLIATSKVTDVITEQEISFNKQVIKTVDVFFSGKCRSLKNTLISLYQDAYAKASTGKTGKDVMNMLRSDSSVDAVSSLEYQQSTYRYIEETGLGRDEDLNTVSVINAGTQKIASSWRRVSPSGDAILSLLMPETESVRTTRPKVYYKPAFDINEYSKMFLIYDEIRDTNNLSVNLGFLAFGYGPEVIKNSYSHYGSLMKGSILILMPDGGVMFDSSDRFYGETFPDFNEIKELKNGTVYGKDEVINVIYNNEFGYYTIGIIPKDDLNSIIGSAKRLIWMLMLISINFIIFLSYVSTSMFSRRVKILIDGIKKIMHGDFSVRVHVGGNDELHEISSNLNLMCDMLDDHIKKEYLYKLMQREAELNSLQSQINPHFLYNSLEAIRMCALKADNKDVEKMVLLLSEIFRSSIKEKIVVSIRDELDNCKSFLEFYNIRYESRLEIIYDIDEDILEYGILRHLIQPIVENVLIHGINLSRGNNAVTIIGYMRDGDIYICVRDNGYGISKDRLEDINENLNDYNKDYRGTIGLYNVNQRVKLIFGEEYGLKVKSEVDKGTEVTLRIRAKSIEELENDV